MNTELHIHTHALNEYCTYTCVHMDIVTAIFHLSTMLSWQYKECDNVYV